MINGYETVTDIAKKWDLTARTVQSMCAEGKIPGAVKFGRGWAIPNDADKPVDGREKSGLYKGWRKKKDA